MVTSSCNRKQDSEAGTSAPHLKLMQGLPPKVNGCNCYFAPTEKEFKKEQYLFVSDLDSNAYVSINGQVTNLKLTSTTRNDGTPQEHDYQQTYTDGVYMVVVNVNYKEHTEDEVWWNTGDIKLFFKGVEMETVSFLGECGC